MYGDIDIDLAPTIEYATNKALAYFGKDSISLSIKNNIQNRIKNSIIDCSKVQCIGMPNPISIEEIFQPLNLRIHHYPEAGLVYNRNEKINYSIKDIVTLEKSLIVLGGPGAGKSIFLNWIFLSQQKKENSIAIIFRLREPNSIIELEEFIGVVTNTRIVKKKESVLLLIDGYDEVSIKLRKEISYLLNKFESSQKGKFILTCRLHYSIIDLKAKHLFLDSFTPRQSIKFTKTYLKLYKVDYSAEKLIAELIDRGFEDFLCNPLLLTLVCVLKTGPFPQLPKNTIGLIERAIQTLTRKWDDSRGIAREPTIIIDGEDRMKCLSRIAYFYDQPIGKESIAIRQTELQLKKIQLTNINPFELLLEIAQWYGLFVPVENTLWEFSHRTIHDYLAAKYWINSGSLNAHSINNKMWNERTAYAASLIEDSTSIISKALKHSLDETMFIECLKNNASFDTYKIGKKLKIRYKDHNALWKIEKFPRKKYHSRITIKPNIFEFASNDFIETLVDIGSYNTDEVNTLFYTMSLIEYDKRKLNFDFVKREDLIGHFFEHDGYMIDINQVYSKSSR